MTRVRFPKTIRLPHDAYGRPENVFHVTIRAAVERAPFANPAVAAAVWSLVLNERTRGDIRVLAGCLMPDHLHLLVAPQGADLIRWVDGFKSYSTRVSWRFQHGALWQPGFHDRRVRNEQELLSTLHYILGNPFADGLVDDNLEWPYLGCWVDGWGA